jgi:hypothetical protein
MGCVFSQKNLSEGDIVVYNNIFLMFCCRNVARDDIGIIFSLSVSK